MNDSIRLTVLEGLVVELPAEYLFRRAPVNGGTEKVLEQRAPLMAAAIDPITTDFKTAHDSLNYLSGLIDRAMIRRQQMNLRQARG